jgi:hypothetical protein
MTCVTDVLFPAHLSHAWPEMHPANIGQSDKFILGKHLSPNWLGRSQALISRHCYTVSRRFRLLNPRSDVTLGLDAVIGSKSAGCISGHAWDTCIACSHWCSIDQKRIIWVRALELELSEYQRLARPT